MSQQKIARVIRMKLRDVWNHEAYDLTTWLQSNLDVLNSITDLNLLTAEREQAAGDFSVDLVAEDDQGNKIIIENQLEKSDHDHLGKLVTYLSMVDATKAIWIVREARPEHISAVTWLNQSNNADFYLVKIEAIRIENSPPAPWLTLIVGPSQEGKDAGEVKQGFAERHSIRKKWWKSLIERAAKRNKLHSHITPSENGSIGTSVGSGAYLNYAVMKNSCRVELYIDSGKGGDEKIKNLFDALYAHKAEIEVTFGQELHWEHTEGRRCARIEYTRENCGYRLPEEEWPKAQDLVIDDMDRLEKSIRPFLSQVRTAA